LDDNHITKERQGPGWFARLLRSLGGKRRALSEQDLQDLITESEEEGIINEEEGDMLASIFQFGETIVREVMVPRIDMVCCPLLANFEELLQTILGSGHSRVPIYEGTTDRIVGLVYAKDLLKHWGEEASLLTVAEVMRPPYFIPETKLIDELLQDFRQRRIHLAIAVDEFGGTSGLITIEDLLEEIVGEIQDEYDSEEEQIQPEGGGSLLLDARLTIYELEQTIEAEIPNKEHFDTLGGYLIHLTGHVPVVGETIEEGAWRLTVVEGDERRIAKVRMEPLASVDDVKPDA